MSSEAKAELLQRLKFTARREQGFDDKAAMLPTNPQSAGKEKAFDVLVKKSLSDPLPRDAKFGEYPDHRDPTGGWPASNQGTTGACVGYATAGLLTWVFRRQRNGKGEYVLSAPGEISPRYMWMAAKENSKGKRKPWQPHTFLETAGTYIQDALEVAQDYGAATELLLPFDVKQHGLCSMASSDDFYSQCSPYKGFLIQRVQFDKWRNYLSLYGPIAASFDVCDAFLDPFCPGPRLLENYHAPAEDRTHAVLIVGFVQKEFSGVKTECFVVRNSWDPKIWGDNGFFYLSVAYAKGAFTGGWSVVFPD